MKTDWEYIVTEWFSRLPNGLASSPYTETELAVLGEVLIENGFNDKEKDQIKSPEKSGEEPPEGSEEPDTRFRAKSAPIVSDVKSFIRYIRDNYLSDNIEINGLEDLFIKVISSSEDSFQEVVGLLNSGTARDWLYGTCQLSKYEGLLLSYMLATLDRRIAQILFIAIIFNSRITNISPDEVNDTIYISEHLSGYVATEDAITIGAVESDSEHDINNMSNSGVYSEEVIQRINNLIKSKLHGIAYIAKVNNSSVDIINVTENINKFTSNPKHEKLNNGILINKGIIKIII